MQNFLSRTMPALLLSLGLCLTVMAKALPGNADLSRRFAREGMVLLKNDRETLPLAPGATTAIFGKGQIDFFKGGLGSGNVTVEHTVNLLDGLEVKAGENKIVLAAELADAYRANPDLALTPELAARAARMADNAVIVISRNSEEGQDRTAGAGDYLLSTSEETMLQLVTAAGFDRVIVVLNVGGVLDTSWLDRYPVDALLVAWLPGLEGGLATADILVGDAAPSGKLTDTWAKSFDAYPSSRHFAESEQYVLYEEDIFVGYRYFATFDPHGKKVAFPFGFGLSYTSFSLSPAAPTIADGTVAISVTVTNTGKRAGREVVQLYYSAPQGQLGRPARELGAFAKTGRLEPGESEQLTLRMPVTAMAAYDDTGKTGRRSCWLLEPGDYQFFVGNSSCDAAVRPVGSYTEPALRVVEEAAERLAPRELPRRLLANGSFETLNDAEMRQAAGSGPVHVIAPDQITKVEAEDFAAAADGIAVEGILDAAGLCKCLAHMYSGRQTVYQLQLGQAGKYALRFRTANGGAEIPDSLELFLNDVRQELTVAIPRTGYGEQGEWYNFIDLPPVLLDLPAGRVTLKIVPKGAYGNTDYLLLAPAAGQEQLFAAYDRAGAQQHAALEARLAAFRTRPDAGPRIKLAELVGHPEQLDDFLAQLSDADLARLAGGAPSDKPWATGRIGVLEDFGSRGVETFDGPAGVRLAEAATAWPCAVAIASSWDPDLAEQIGRAVAAEAGLNGLDIWLAPGMNIHRNPLCGRNFEYYSEDPVLSGKIAAGLTRGAQSNGVGVTLKHIVANNKENNRTNSDSRVSERALREIYLKGFRIAIQEAAPWCIMSSYNKVNGRETAENRELLTGILRQEWHYDGLVMTDWGNNSLQTLEIKAGSDVKMPNGQPDGLLAALHAGELTRTDLERGAKRVLELVLKREAASTQ